METSRRACATKMKQRLSKGLGGGKRGGASVPSTASSRAAEPQPSARTASCSITGKSHSSFMQTGLEAVSRLHFAPSPGCQRVGNEDGSPWQEVPGAASSHQSRSAAAAAAPRGCRAGRSLLHTGLRAQQQQGRAGSRSCIPCAAKQGTEHPWTPRFSSTSCSWCSVLLFAAPSW